MCKKKYIPQPIDTSEIRLSDDLCELSEIVAKHVHEVWAKGRIEQGWTCGPVRDDKMKETPCLVPYNDLPDEEKDYDRNTSQETLKLLIKLGYKIVKD
jgi:ryanodine receptor 2